MWSSMAAVNAAFREHARRLACQSTIRQNTYSVDMLRAAAQLCYGRHNKKHDPAVGVLMHQQYYLE